jgi:hypothetical protein
MHTPTDYIKLRPSGGWLLVDPDEAARAAERELDRLHRRAGRRLRRRLELEALEPLDLAEFNRRGRARRLERDRRRSWVPLALIIGATLGLLFIFGWANAEAAAPAYPGGAPATSPLMLELEADVDHYWRAEGLDVAGACPAGVTVLVATDLGDADGVSNGPAGGRGGGCAVWLSAGTVDAYSASALEPFFASTAGAELWTLLAHEYGHALGLPHTATGLMCGPPASGEHYCHAEPVPNAVAFGWRLQSRADRTACRTARATRRTAQGHRARQRARKRAHTACQAMRATAANAPR